MAMAPAVFRRLLERAARHRDNQHCRVIPQHGGGETLAFRRRRDLLYRYSCQWRF